MSFILVIVDLVCLVLVLDNGLLMSIVIFNLLWYVFWFVGILMMLLVWYKVVVGFKNNSGLLGIVLLSFWIWFR